MNVLSFNLLHIHGQAQTEYEDTRCIGVRQHRRITWILFIELSQVIEMRLMINVNAVVADRCTELEGLEKSARAMARENRYAVG